jgi:hypothetical protein
MNPEQAPLTDKEAADVWSWHLAAIEQWDDRDEQVEAVFKKLIDEYGRAL